MTLSDEMKHDSAFASVVVHHLLEQDDPEIIRLKSDNCSPQYKSKYVFKQWQLLAQISEKIVLVYYGVSGHGKGLVDAMSAFGVKRPLQRAVVTLDFSYSNSKDIYEFLIDKYHNDEIKHYSLIDKDEITEKRKSNPLLIIKDCMEKHMLAFSPNGCVQTKVNISSCNVCIKGEFTSCSHEVGKKLFFNYDSDEETSGGESDEEFECEDIINNEEDGAEENEIRADCVVDAVKPGSYTALYSSPESFEMFYLGHFTAI